jgi:hypothetical protein
MDFQDAETRRPSAEAATKAAPFNGIPRIVSIDYSSRKLPIQGGSDSASQRAQAQDQAETSTSTSRNLPIREVSDSASQRSQDQEVRFQKAIQMFVEVTRGLTSVEQDVANREAIAFVFHTTLLQAATSLRIHQDQDQESTLNADAPV